MVVVVVEVVMVVVEMSMVLLAWTMLMVLRSRWTTDVLGLRSGPR